MRKKTQNAKHAGYPKISVSIEPSLFSQIKHKVADTRQGWFEVLDEALRDWVKKFQSAKESEKTETSQNTLKTETAKSRTRDEKETQATETSHITKKSQKTETAKKPAKVTVEELGIVEGAPAIDPFTPAPEPTPEDAGQLEDDFDSFLDSDPVALGRRKDEDEGWA